MSAESSPSRLVEDKPIGIVIDSGGSCNLMSAEVFKDVTEEKVSNLCYKKVLQESVRLCI